jgi:hypothetical protein
MQAHPPLSRLPADVGSEAATRKAGAPLHCSAPWRSADCAARRRGLEVLEPLGERCWVDTAFGVGESYRLGGGVSAGNWTDGGKG